MGSNPWTYESTILISSLDRSIIILAFVTDLKNEEKPPNINGNWSEKNIHISIFDGIFLLQEPPSSEIYLF